jgi:putative hydrolase of the HAD superfamily
VTWVMFDYGGVISHPPTQQDLALLAGVAGAAVPAFTERYWAWRRAYDLAELDVTGYWQQVGSDLGRSYSGTQIAELARLDRASWLRLQAGTVTLIEDLAAAGQPLALLSNAPDQLAEAISGLPVARHFGHLLFSCQLKLAKPDPACYRRALGALRADPRDVVFVDDRGENVTAAATLGLRSVLFTGTPGMRAAVTRQLEDAG